MYTFSKDSGEGDGGVVGGFSSGSEGIAKVSRLYTIQGINTTEFNKTMALF